mgnify:CR=1 FL=1
MVSINFIKRGLQNPIFSIEAAISYLMQKDDIEYIRKSLSAYYDKIALEKFAIGASAGIKEIAIYLIVKKYKPKLMVETGVANGVSTYFILKAMHENKMGKLISIDYPNYNPKGYINEDGKPDAVFIPQGKEPGWLIPTKLKCELEWAYTHVKKGGLIMADDTNTNNAWKDFLSSKNLKILRLPISVAVKR